MTRLRLNGRSLEAPDVATVEDLARWLSLPAFGAAVEVNGAVVRTSEHAATPLRDGDRVEVVRLVGGG